MKLELGDILNHRLTRNDKKQDDSIYSVSQCTALCITIINLSEIRLLHVHLILISPLSLLGASGNTSTDDLPINEEWRDEDWGLTLGEGDWYTQNHYQKDCNYPLQFSFCSLLCWLRHCVEVPDGTRLMYDLLSPEQKKGLADTLQKRQNVRRREIFLLLSCFIIKIVTLFNKIVPEDWSFVYFIIYIPKSWELALPIMSYEWTIISEHNGSYIVFEFRYWHRETWLR